MSEQQHDEESLEHPTEHPKGTLAIVILYGLLFAAGWIALYVFEFLPRGAPN